MAALLGVAALGVALPAGGALAGGGGEGDGTGAGTGAAASDPGFVQSSPDRSGERRDWRDCPKDKDGERRGGEREGSSSGVAGESQQL
jgi:hypothetical protein